MVDPVGRQCLHKGVGDLGLTDELSKRLRSISSIESSHHALSLPRSPEHFSALKGNLELAGHQEYPEQWWTYPMTLQQT